MKHTVKKGLVMTLSAVTLFTQLNLNHLPIFAKDTELMNVALTGKAEATQENKSYPAGKAIDGIINTTSYWDSGAVDIDANEEVFLDIDLQKEYELKKLVLFTYPGNVYGQSYPREYKYTVFVSKDKKAWEEVGSRKEGASTEAGDTFDFAAPKTARYVRVRFDGSNCIQNNTDNEQIMHLIELQAWAEVDKQPEVPETLENIAKTEDFTLENTSTGYKTSSICDGDKSTLWATNSWNTVPTFTYTVPKDNTKPIRKITLDFEGGQHAPDRMVDITLEVLYKGEMEKKVIDTKQAFSFLEQYTYEFEGTSEIEEIYVTLSNPKLHSGNEVLFTPAFAEVGIYVDKETDAPNMSKFVNVAADATITPFEGAEPETESERLVDKDYKTLFTFHKGAFSTLKDKEVSVVLDLGKEDYDVNAFEIAFEKVANENDKFHYTYSIYTQKAGDSKWTQRVKSAKATRHEGDNIKVHKLAKNDETVKVNKVKIVLEDMTETAWPSMAEFKVFGIEKVNADGNIAFQKSTHTNTNQANENKITDGKVSSKWTGVYYPGYVDIDLEKNYKLDEMKVYLPTSGYSQYDVYTSMDGEDFTKIYSKTNEKSTPATGDVIDLKNVKDREARIVRLYVNYQSGASTNVSINEVKIYGEETGTKVQEAAPIEVKNYEDSEYAVEISDQMVFDEVKGIISRQVGGQYVDWFSFELQENPHKTGYDYFQLTEKDGKIHITGNDGVSLATGVNHYLKYFCNVNISQVGNQVTMPNEIVSLNGETIFKETKMPIRYAYNYCTHSYSMPFWGEEEWRNELDWLALNGVNVVLDMTGQEEVWRRFLGEIGYSPEEAKDFIAGPAYYAWAYMSNLSNYGGPVHNTWFAERVDLARKNQFAMRKLGMKPIMQGYSGMVPTDVETKDSRTKGSVLEQGLWNGFQRPSMLRTTDPIYKTYADLYYKIQRDVFGDITNYYATDPFHEGGITGDMNPADISRIVLDEMIKADSDAVWVIQSWQANPTPALLEGIGDRKEHALVLDLWAEKDPRWDGESHYGYNFPKEFGNTPWVWCLLNNFGGRPGLKGYVDVLINDFPTAYNETKHMAGIGITPEASYNNPVIYDLFFELIWVDDATKPLEKTSKDEWVNDYITRRYGAESKAAKQAWDILNETVYNSKVNNNGEGPVCSVVNARPGLDISNVSCCDSTTIQYDKEQLEKAAKLLVEDYDKLSASEGYQYDLVSVLLQVLANTAQEYQVRMSKAFRAGNLEEFKQYSDTFMEIIDKTDLIASTQETMMVGTWIEQSKDLAKNADEFSKELYEFNARSLVSTWGSKYQANSLHDYSNRQWSGLTKDLYKKRWQLWIDERIKELKGEKFEAIDWFEVEWEWANSNNTYATQPTKLNMKEEANEILTKYVVSSLPKNPAEDDSKDLPVGSMSVTAGSEQAQEGEQGPAKNVIDQNNTTIWHSVWSGTERENLWINLHLSEPTTVDGLRYLPRQSGSNGIITGYVIEVSKDNGNSYKQVASGTWENSADWKLATFTAEEKVTDVRLKATASVTDSSKKNYASAAEIRITSPKAEVPDVDKTALENAIKTAEEKAKDKELYVDFSGVEDALKKAKEILDKKDATESEVANATKALEEAIEALVLKKADYSAVDAAVAKAKALNPTDYVDFSGVEKALAAVKYDLDITKQAEVDGYAKAINDAIEALERKPVDPQEPVNKEDLQEAVDKASKLEKEDYTEESWKVFEEAYTKAKDVLSNEEATAKEVEEAKNALSEAIEQLKPVETKPITPEEPEKPNKGGSKNTGDYTNAITYAALLAGSGLLLGGILLNKKRRGAEKNK